VGSENEISKIKNIVFDIYDLVEWIREHREEVVRTIVSHRNGRGRSFDEVHLFRAYLFLRDLIDDLQYDFDNEYMNILMPLFENLMELIVALAEVIRLTNIRT